MNKTRKITYSAVGAAIAALCVFLTNFGWLKVSLLMFAALCYYIVACKCGIWYGIAGIAVSLLIAFFTGGVTVLSSAFLLDALIFAPFAILSYFIRKLYYTKWQTALIRLAVMATFSNLALVAVWFCAKWITTIDIIAISSKLGGYPLLALVFTLLALVFDLLFNQLSIRLTKLIK
ncbi:hypothetical protein [Pumilibacter muris]|uniref:hypothetical protein n=1 Tax=Pumilibacter muris TaxID=2941510 RepID=UPI00203D491F|nr:hypothetical protein [Pumilibacter muris]